MKTEKPNRRKYFVGTKKLKHVKLFENFLEEKVVVDSTIIGKNFIDVQDKFEDMYGMSGTIVAADEFKTWEEAVKFVENKGYAVGRMQAYSPRGFKKGTNWDIMKWRNLSKEDKADLDGCIAEFKENANGVKVLWKTFPKED